MSTEMEIGALYEVRFKRQTGNGRWTLNDMTAVYLGRNKQMRTIDFSLRPQAGTMGLNIDWTEIVEASMVMSKDRVMALRNGIRDKGLPVRLPQSLGYTDKPKNF